MTEGSLPLYTVTLSLFFTTLSSRRSTPCKPRMPSSWVDLASHYSSAAVSTHAGRGTFLLAILDLSCDHVEALQMPYDEVVCSDFRFQKCSID